jgi:hypothetical protein
MRDIWSRVNKSGTCWHYTGATARGYGWVYNPGGTRLAHRIAYEDKKGAIPVGFHIDHLCFVRDCVNPDHLEAVTPGENVRRANVYHGKSRTACRRGHLRNEQNSRPRKDGRGMVCRVCHREYMREYDGPKGQQMQSPSELTRIGRDLNRS